ncbi:MAG TPA: M14 family zinc carboxypeptidase [Oligoflexus sp.]|uniref:M14 family zinc carboxypeptidase n=1 Tax=Oligoflexus sp. TaxID=1971216 RepID=UPI002D7F1CCA|nr:M14 family zinc carboxypeptidase [Oligoflexus sp.]HET9239122.1 M14 family zinc carboxypeptidase [Oligoflexus sp.]
MKSQALPLTRAEATDYRETTRSAEVLTFMDELCAATPLVKRLSLGTSSQGQDIAALVISDRQCFTPELAQKQKKCIVMVEANIHAGEVEGKESLLALARDLTLTSLGRNILNRTCLVLVPNFNPDGNDIISPAHRQLDLSNLEGQDGPESGVGIRYNGEGYNLNRDSMKQEAPETRAMARFYQAWWPHLFIDCHTTDGSLHAFDLTFDTSRGNEELFAPVRGFARGMLERVSKSVESKHDFKSYWYGNFVKEDDPLTGWHTYPALPRFGSHYRGLLGRLDVLLETYSYIPFARRCAVMRAWLLELFRFAALKREPILKLMQAERKRLETRGLVFDPSLRMAINHGVARQTEDQSLVFDYPAYALHGDTAIIQSFDKESLSARRYPGRRSKVYKIPHLRGHIPTEEVTVPMGYLAPASLADKLSMHGIQLTAATAGTRYRAERYRLLGKEETFSPDVATNVTRPGEKEIPLSQKPQPKRFETVLTVRPERSEFTVPEGWIWIPVAQRAGTLAVYLLEPHADDGLARWQFLDEDLKVGGYYPVVRVLEHQNPPRKAE